jgi:AraC-like DNA-binding protein
MDYLEIVQKSLCYIEDNLTNNLSLNHLAGQAFLSTFYYHRIFQSVVGIPVMEHVRKRRLAHSSFYLINADSSIINIAMRYQFNSQDVFIRAFKRYYGVSPSRYRKLNQKIISINTGKIPKEAYTMLDWEISQRLTSSSQDKKECLELFNTIINYSERVRKHGLLSLEPEIDKSHSFFMRKSLQFIVDGVEPTYIRNILQNYIFTGNYHGKELLERLLITEGILSIQAGENPILIREKLSSYFGEEFADEIDNFFGNDLDSKNEKIQSYIDTVKDLAPFSSSTSLLEAPIQKLDDRSLQRLLREIDIQDLLLALKGASGKVQEHVIKNISKKVAFILVEELSSLKQPVPHQIIESQHKVLEIMLKLRADKEIM